jgi:hypothetical protein
LIVYPDYINKATEYSGCKPVYSPAEMNEINIRTAHWQVVVSGIAAAYDSVLLKPYWYNLQP